MFYKHWGSIMGVKNILFYGLFLIFLLIGFSNINKSTESLDTNRVKNSLDTALISCYSVEGRYPSIFKKILRLYI